MSENPWNQYRVELSRDAEDTTRELFATSESSAMDQCWYLTEQGWSITNVELIPQSKVNK